MRRKRFTLPGKGSLTRNITLKIGGWVTVVVFLTAILSYLQVAAKIEQQALRQLQSYVSRNAVDRENQLFKQTEISLLALKQRILNDLSREKNYPPSIVDEITQPLSNSSHEMVMGSCAQVNIPELACMYIGSTELNAQLKHRLVRWYTLVGNYGRAWMLFLIMFTSNCLNTMCYGLLG
ncbi:MAG: hypothetical protein R3E08_00860 [Thiotrichaceae bacterium]